MTDYFATPLTFTDGTTHVATWTTREPRGFADEQIAGLEAIITPVAWVAEVRALRRMASTVLDTYVGHDAGERILAGHIRRGDIEEIHAAGGTLLPYCQPRGLQYYRVEGLWQRVLCAGCNATHSAVELVERRDHDNGEMARARMT